jgi:hypothetical protein
MTGPQVTAKRVTLRSHPGKRQIYPFLREFTLIFAFQGAIHKPWPKDQKIKWCQFQRASVKGLPRLAKPVPRTKPLTCDEKGGGGLEIQKARDNPLP